MELMSRANGKLVHPTDHKIIGDIPVGDVLFQPPIVTVGYRKISDGPGEDGSVKHRRSIVNEFGVRVAEQERQAAGKTFLQFSLHSMVVGIADIVAEQRDIGKAREWLEELRLRHRWPANGG